MKMNYAIHHQAVGDCPKCGELIIEDLGECPEGDGVETTCHACNQDIEFVDEEI